MKARPPSRATLYLAPFTCSLVSCCVYIQPRAPILESIVCVCVWEYDCVYVRSRVDVHVRGWARWERPRGPARARQERLVCACSVSARVYCV